MISLDALQAILWGCAYVMIIFFNIRNNEPGIPPIAMSNNFAWETMALLCDLILSHSVMWIHIVWISLDAIILITYLACCRPVYCRHKVYVLGLIAMSLGVFCYVFLKIDNGMLISSFIIDFTMAAEYLLYAASAKFRPGGLATAICIAKLAGDMCAWLFYKDMSAIVMIIGVMVLLLNLGCTMIMIIRVRNTGKPSKIEYKAE